MIAAVHALVGATLGRLCGSYPAALAAGVVSHAACDVVPHKDLTLPVEAPLLAGTLALLAWRCRIKSPELTGAVGAVLPDAENAAWMVGLIPRNWVRFPTHIAEGRYHGAETRSALPQAVLAGACLFFLLRSSSRKP